MEQYLKCLEDKYTLDEQAEANAFVSWTRGCRTCQAAKKLCGGPRNDIPTRQHLPVSCGYCYKEKKVCLLVVRDSDLKGYYPRPVRTMVRQTRKGSKLLQDPSVASTLPSVDESNPVNGVSLAPRPGKRCALGSPPTFAPSSHFSALPHAPGTVGLKPDVVRQLLLLQKLNQGIISTLILRLGKFAPPEHAATFYAVGARIWDLDEDFVLKVFGEDTWNVVDVMAESGHCSLVSGTDGVNTGGKPFTKYCSRVTGGRLAFCSGGLYGSSFYSTTPVFLPGESESGGVQLFVEGDKLSGSFGGHRAWADASVVLVQVM